jgi:integrase
VKLTDLTVRNLEPPAKGQKYWFDETLSGFCCRVSQGGTKTFVLLLGQDRRHITIGRYPVISLSEARTEAKRQLAEFTLGKVRPQSISYAQAIELFLKDKAQAKRPSTVYGYRRHLERLNFKGQLSEFDHAEFARRLDRFKAPSARSHILVTAKVFFNWCIKRRYITENPVLGLTKAPTPRRHRVLSDPEIRAIWEACSKLGMFGQIVRLFILCGQRSREVAALQAEFFDEDICTLPGTLTKNHRTHPFPMGELFKQLLTELPNEGPLFRFNDWGHAKAELDKLCPLPHWVLHDIRRTFRTNLGKLGVAPHVAERLVNHISTQSDMEQTYNLYAYMPEMRDAISRWESHLSQVIAA